MFRSILVTWLMAIVACMATCAQAELLRGHDPSVTGNGNAAQDGYNVTYDTETDLSWLDLTLSQGLSYNTVLSQLDPGDLFTSFRFATGDELISLWDHAGLSLGNTSPPDPDATTFVALVGDTGGVSGYGSVAFGYRDPAPYSPAVSAGLYVDDQGETTVFSAYGVSADDSAAHRGSWLLRSGGPPTLVPEPSTATLLVIGMGVGLGMWGLCRRRRAKASIE